VAFASVAPCRSYETCPRLRCPQPLYNIVATARVSPEVFDEVSKIYCGP